MAMGDYFLDLAREKRRNPDDLIISRLVTASYTSVLDTYRSRQ